MNKEYLLTQFMGVERIKRVKFLCQLAFNLTLVSRAQYRGECDVDTNKLIRVNELQHRICRFSIDLIDGNIVRSDAEIVEYVIAGFQEVGATHLLEEALNNL